ncbi:MAG: D-alanyl-D-alanine carboxypeptidase [Firmicutes bacterium]|nr:D-alanyl-D-alanine carboxypeptidase [Bacillota bacterium]
MFKRVASILLVLALLIGLMVSPAWAEPEAEKTPTEKSALLETTAEAAVLLDYQSGKVIFSKNPDKKLPMASVTKLMTMLLACEAEAKNQIKLTDMVAASEHAASMGGSQIYLEPGEELTFEEMMISIATGSANDSSVAVAEQIGGSEEAFVKMMNDKAKELGLSNTHFSNPTGLPVENHYTTAADMSVILREALEYPLFRKVSGMYEHDLRDGEFKLWNTNKLLKWYRGCDAGKTGWTNDAKYCLAASAERDNLRLISVVLGCPQPKTHFQETIKLFNYGFARYQAVLLAKKAEKIKTVPLEKGMVENIDVITAEQVSVVVPRGGEKGIEGKVELKNNLVAPVKKGQVVGQYTVIKEGKELNKVDLVVKADVAKASPFQLMGKVMYKVFGMNEKNK